MKFRILLLCMIMLPTLASAEIYKWKDKDGKVRYTDVPPPSNIKQEELGKKIQKPTGQAPLSPVQSDTAVTADKQKQLDREKAAGGKPSLNPAPMNKEEAATKRAREAEQAKATDEANKIKEQNCKSAQANLKTHTDGGRLVKTNEKGEREYMTDADVKAGIASSQADIDKYCN